MTPGWILGVFLYLLSIFLIHHLSNHTGTDLKPCLLWQTTGLPCPLCGGTRASIALISGSPSEAIQWNPLVATSLSLVAICIVLRLGVGIRPRTAMSRTWILAGSVVLVGLNWAYLLNRFQS